MPTILLMVGTRKGAFFLTSDDSRSHWSISGPHMKGWEVGALTLDNRKGSRIFAGLRHEAFGPAIQVSDDLGQTWRKTENRPAYSKKSGFRMNRIWTIALDPADENVLYAGVAQAGLFVSNDDGEHWEQVSSLTSHETRSEWYPGARFSPCGGISPRQRNPRDIPPSPATS
ncbi:MAG: WD40/YVTN/BNR-like repeat-containing protein [Fidelibacterota bacterium]